MNDVIDSSIKDMEAIDQKLESFSLAFETHANRSMRVGEDTVSVYLEIDDLLSQLIRAAEETSPEEVDAIGKLRTLSIKFTNTMESVGEVMTTFGDDLQSIMSVNMDYCNLAQKLWNALKNENKENG